MAADSIEREIVIAAPVERVFEVVSRAEHMGRWFGDAGAHRDGDRIVMHWREHGDVTLVVEREEPPHVFAYRWAPFRDPDGVEPVAGNSTRVEFTLTAEDDGGTRLRVRETGFAALDCSPEQRERNAAGNREGWEIELGDLRAYLQTVAA